MSTPKSELRELKICVASSIHEFKREREEIVHYFEQLNPVYEKDGIFFNPVTWQTMSHELTDEGSQSRYDNEIRSCQFFFTIIGQKAGDVTVHEFDVAYNHWQKCNEPRQPNIYVLFIRPPEGLEVDESVTRFKGRFRSSGHYYDEIENNEIDRAELIKFRLVTDVTSSQLFRRLLNAKADYVDERTRQNLDQMRVQMRENIQRIERLKLQGINRDTIPLILDLYVKNWLRVREFKIEPDSVFDYASFLADQTGFSQAIELGQWLEKFYDLENAEAQKVASVKDLLGRCFHSVNRFAQGEVAFKEALSIRRQLAKENSSDSNFNAVSSTCNNFGLLLYTTARYYDADLLLREALSTARSTPLLAHTHNNIGNLMKLRNKLEEAEVSYLLARSIWQILSDGDPRYLGDLAITNNNLANVFKEVGRIDESLELFREALSIYQTLAEENPDAYLERLAWTYSEMGGLLKDTFRMKEAEEMLKKALAIRQRLANINQSAFSVGVAFTLSHLASLYAMTNRVNEAKQFYMEALEIFEQYPERVYEKMRTLEKIDFLDMDDYLKFYQNMEIIPSFFPQVFSFRTFMKNLYSTRFFRILREKISRFTHIFS